jgi:hypothetical protein
LHKPIPRATLPSICRLYAYGDMSRVFTGTIIPARTVGYKG